MLSIWELKQLFYFQLRLLGVRKWGISQPPPYKYFFWGLHSRPEDSTSVLGYGEDECELISQAASMLPKGVRLLVKEHPIMFGVRSGNFYKSLLKSPNLVLVDAFSETQDFISSEFCIAVIGISGTMLLESELKGKPAFAVGSPEFKSYLSSANETLGSFITSSIHSNSGPINSKVDEYAKRVLALSSDEDVPYLHDLQDPKVRKMVRSWANTLTKGGLNE